MNGMSVWDTAASYCALGGAAGAVVLLMAFIMSLANTEPLIKTMIGGGIVFVAGVAGALGILGVEQLFT